MNVSYYEVYKKFYEQIQNVNVKISWITDSQFLLIRQLMEGYFGLIILESHHTN